MILVVDDNRNLGEAVAGLLTESGYPAECAFDGREALEKVQRSQEPPFLVLLDLTMPRLDGWGFLSERQRDPVLSQVPVVVMSALDGVDQEVRQAGADAFLSKPVSAADLLAFIGKLDLPHCENAEHPA